MLLIYARVNRKPGTEEKLLLFSWFPYKKFSQKVVMLQDGSAKGFDTDEHEFSILLVLETRFLFYSIVSSAFGFRFGSDQFGDGGV